MKYGVSKQFLLITAGLVWIIAGVNVLRIGIITWMNCTENWLLEVGEATVVFLLFYLLIFRKLYQAYPPNRRKGIGETRPSFLFRYQRLVDHGIHDCLRGYHPAFPTTSRKFYFGVLYGIVHCSHTDRHTVSSLLVAET